MFLGILYLSAMLQIAIGAGNGKPSFEPEKAWVPGRPLIIEGTLVTMGVAGVIEGGRLYLANGKIEAVRRAEEAFPTHLKISGVQVIRTKDLVIPGFLNLHTHVPYNLQP